MKQFDNLVGSVLSAGSAIEQRFPVVQNLLKDQTLPNVVLRWRRARLSRDDEPSDWPWVEVPNDPESGISPKNFRSAEVIRVARGPYDTLRQSDGGRQAVAYLLGKSCVMMGEKPGQDFFGISDDGSEYQVAMGLGHGEARFMVGYASEDHRFTNSYELFLGHKTVSVAELGSHIPLVQ